MDPLPLPFSYPLCIFGVGFPGHGEGSPRKEGQVRALAARGLDTAAGGGDSPAGVPNEPAESGRGDTG